MNGSGGEIVVALLWAFCGPKGAGKIIKRKWGIEAVKGRIIGQTDSKEFLVCSMKKQPIPKLTSNDKEHRKPAATASR